LPRDVERRIVDPQRTPAKQAGPIDPAAQLRDAGKPRLQAAAECLTAVRQPAGVEDQDSTLIGRTLLGLDGEVEQVGGAKPREP
jgi:hypothetical protein